MKVGKTYEAGMARQVLGVGINYEIEKSMVKARV